MLTAQELNETVWARIKPSTIDGVGVFAIRNIPRGQNISNVTIDEFRLLTTISVEELDTLHPQVKKLLLDQFLSHREDKIVCKNPNAMVNLRCFMNHSETPNTDGVMALRDISEGEELTEDYTMFGELSSISKKHYDTIL